MMKGHFVPCQGGTLTGHHEELSKLRWTLKTLTTAMFAARWCRRWSEVLTMYTCSLDGMGILRKSDMWMWCWVSSFKSVYTYNRQWVYCNMSCDNTVIMLLKCIFIYFLQKLNFVYSCFCSTTCSCGSNSHSVSRTFLYGWGSRGNRNSASHGDWQKFNMLLFLPIILFYYSFKFCLLFSLTLPTKLFR